MLWIIWMPNIPFVLLQRTLLQLFQFLSSRKSAVKRIPLRWNRSHNKDVLHHPIYLLCMQQTLWQWIIEAWSYFSWAIAQNSLKTKRNWNVEILIKVQHTRCVAVFCRLFYRSAHMTHSYVHMHVYCHISNST